MSKAKSDSKSTESIHKIHPLFDQHSYEVQVLLLENGTSEHDLDERYRREIEELSLSRQQAYQSPPVTPELETSLRPSSDPSDPPDRSLSPESCNTGSTYGTSDASPRANMFHPQARTSMNIDSYFQDNLEMAPPLRSQRNGSLPALSLPPTITRRAISASTVPQLKSGNFKEHLNNLKRFAKRSRSV